MIRRHSAYLAVSLTSLALIITGCSSPSPKTRPKATPVVDTQASVLAARENDVKANPKDVHAWHELAKAYVQSKYYSKAIGAAQAGIDLDPTNQELRVFQAATSVDLARADARIISEQNPSGDILAIAKSLADDVRQSLGVTEIITSDSVLKADGELLKPAGQAHGRDIKRPLRQFGRGHSNKFISRPRLIQPAQPSRRLRPVTANPIVHTHARLIKKGGTRVVIRAVRPVHPIVPRPPVHLRPTPKPRASPVPRSGPAITNQPVHPITPRPVPRANPAPASQPPHSPFDQLHLK